MVSAVPRASHHMAGLRACEPAGGEPLASGSWLTERDLWTGPLHDCMGPSQIFHLTTSRGLDSSWRARTSAADPADCAKASFGEHIEGGQTEFLVLLWWSTLVLAPLSLSRLLPCPWPKLKL